MSDVHRSLCPVNLSLELFGDRWTLLILRDIIFTGRRHYLELLHSQIEGISSNILADRLRMMVDEGLLTRSDDPTHKQRAIYSLTEKSIALVPVFAMIGAWGRRWLPVSEELGARAELLEEGGPAMWDALMAELREAHLGVPARRGASRRGTSVAAELQAAYEAAVARRAAGRSSVRRSSGKRSDPRRRRRAKNG